MVMKGSVLPNHIPVNNYELIVAGLPQLLFTEISGLDDETEGVDLPDRTRASGGNDTGAKEFTAMMFEHHSVELAALQLWLVQGRDPVDPLYKKIGTLIKRNIAGEIATTRTMTGLWVRMRTDPDLELANPGDPAMIQWTFSADTVEPV